MEQKYTDNHPNLFHNTSTISSFDHPTGTIFKPDFVACCATQEKVDCTEIHSTGEIATDGPHHTSTYILHLLQARPDVSVQGFYADREGCRNHYWQCRRCQENLEVEFERHWTVSTHTTGPLLDGSMIPFHNQSYCEAAEGYYDQDVELSDSPSVECVGYRIIVRLSDGGRTFLLTMSIQRYSMVPLLPSKIIAIGVIVSLHR